MKLQSSTAAFLIQWQKTFYTLQLITINNHNQEQHTHGGIVLATKH